MWILTGLAVIVLVITVTFFDRNRQSGSRWWEETVGNQAVESSLRLMPLPDPLREQIVANLPTTNVPPPDGEPCAICFDVDTQHEWRILPCGHRFHPACVDEWIKKQRGTCPTCRQDPTQAQSLGDEEAGWNTRWNSNHISVTDIPTAQLSAAAAEPSTAPSTDAAAATGASSLSPAAAAGTGSVITGSVYTNAPVSEPVPEQSSSPLQALGQVLQQMVSAGAGAVSGAAATSGATSGAVLASSSSASNSNNGHASTGATEAIGPPVSGPAAPELEARPNTVGAR